MPGVPGMPCPRNANVLLYAVSRVPADAEKRERAWTLIDGGGLALSMQVLQEFYYQATRPTRVDKLTDEDAVGFMDSWRRFPVQETTLALLDRGFEIQRRHRFSFWDSMIIAAARAQGCEMLWTEAMDDGRIVDGMRIADPFR
jgi:predicted nucleic acid-binding protein